MEVFVNVLLVIVEVHAQYVRYNKFKSNFFMIKIRFSSKNFDEEVVGLIV
jgi:hypothetical protein